MAWERPTLTELDTRIQTDFKTRIDGASSLLRRSILKIQARVYAGACHLLYGYLQYQKDQIFVTTCDADNLELHGNEYGVAKRDPQKATGTAEATGTATKIIPAGTELISDSDLSYFVDESYTIPASGTIDIDFTAEDYGELYNDAGSITLYFVSPIAGVDSAVTVDVNGIDGGLDEEDTEDYRERVLARKRRAPAGGTLTDYKNWCLEVPGVTRAWAIDEYYGIGTVGIAFARDNDSSIIPSSAEKDEVLEYLYEHTDPTTGMTVGVPVGARPGVIMIDTELEELHFTLKIYPNNSTVQGEIEEKMEDLILKRGGPGVTIYESDQDAAISSAPSETAHKIMSPAADISTATNKIPVLGTITYQDYS